MSDEFPTNMAAVHGLLFPAEGKAPLPLTVNSGGLPDTAAACRERAEADLGRLEALGSEEDRCCHALDAADCLSRAEHLDRLAARASSVAQ